MYGLEDSSLIGFPGGDDGAAHGKRRHSIVPRSLHKVRDGWSARGVSSFSTGSNRSAPFSVRDVFGNASD
jgi:hypothetical protein